MLRYITYPVLRSGWYMLRYHTQLWEVHDWIPYPVLRSGKYMFGYQGVLTNLDF